MTLRRLAVLWCVTLGFGFSFTSSISAAERFVTENFIVTAATAALAKTFGETAEHYRREKALEWLGVELPNWPNRCPLKVEVRLDRTGGETSFTFGVSPGGSSRVLSQDMYIFGETNQLLRSVLPHEVTHTIFAHHFGQAVPRWADEGGSVLSENDDERYSHDLRCRELLNKGQAFPLKSLFTLKQYPSDQHTLYAQGYSVVNYLLGKEGGRRKFLEFVRVGLKRQNNNWDEAVALYGFNSVEELQDDWLTTLKTSRPNRGNATLTSLNPATRTRPDIRPDPRTEASLATAANRGSTASNATTGLQANPRANAGRTPPGTTTRVSPGGPILQLEEPVVARGVAPATPSQPAAGTPAAPALPLPPPLKLGPPELPR